MSKYSEYLKSRKEKELKKFFGETVKIMGDTYDWARVIDNDNILIVTNNVKYWSSKDQYVLVVDNNKVVYLKAWQIAAIKNWDLQLNAYAVKLNRNYFKAYTLGFEFDDMSFDAEDTFDSLLAVAKEQDQARDGSGWKLGHYAF